MLTYDSLIIKIKNWSYETLGKYQLSEEDKYVLLQEYNNKTPKPMKKVTDTSSGIEVAKYYCPICGAEVQKRWKYCPMCRQTMVRAKEDA